MKIKRKLLSLLLCITMCVVYVPGFAAWDGYAETAVGETQRLKIVDTDNLNAIIASGAAPDTDITNGSSYSMRWNNMPSTTRLVFNDVPRDWTDYGRIEFSLYSAKAIDTSLVFAISCDPETSSGVSERYFFIPINFTGWKKFEMPFEDMEVSRSAQLSKVNYMSVWSYGWGIAEANPEADVRFDSIYLARSSITDAYSEETKLLKSECMADALAVYDGSKNVMVNGDIAETKMETPARMVNDTVMVPTSFFAEFVKQENVTAITPQTIDGVSYLPFVKAMESLGKTAVQKGKLAVAGSDKISVVSENRELAELIASEVAYITIDASTLTDDDYKKVKDKWRESVIGKNDLDLSDSVVANRIKNIENATTKLTTTLNRSDNRVNLWGETAPATSTDMSNLYSNVLQMVTGYTTLGTGVYHDEDVKNDILDCLSWLYDNVYGENVLNGNGFLNGSGGDWFDWRIGVPQYIIQILMLMEDDLSQAEIKKYLKPVDKKVPYPQGTGSNKIHEGYVAIGSSILQKDANKLVMSRDSLLDTYQYVEYTNKDVNGEGFYTDGSYIFHTHHPMNGAYGVGMLEAYANIISILDDTVFEITVPQKDNYTDWIYKTFTPFMWNGNMMSMVRGRTIRMGNSSAERSAGREVLVSMLKMMPYQSAEHQKKMKAIVKYQVGEYANEYYQHIPIALINPLKEIMTDEEIIPYEYNDTRIYHKMDRAVHHRDDNDYTFGLAMSSSRVYNYESITGYNTTGWYIGDGMTYIYTDADSQHYEKDFWQNVNPYRMPGTTVDTQEREAASIAQLNEYLSSQDFVGGTTVGETGVAAMSLESYHCDGSWGTNPYHYYPATNTYNAPIHDSSLVAKKAWFMFDDEIVALGTDINSVNGINVETIVDNRRSNTTKVTNESSVATQYEIVSGVASAVPEADNPAENAFDGDYTSRWAAEGPATLTVDLGEAKEVRYVPIAFFNGHKRQTTFDIQISVDGITWETVFKGKSGGKTEGLEVFDIGTHKARYIKYTGYESTGSTWVSVNEIQVYSPSPTGTFSLDAMKSIGMDQIQTDEGNWSMGYDVRTRDASFVHLENFGGYYFPDKTTVNARKTNTNPSFFELWIDHGVDPVGSNYAYSILPGKTYAEMIEYNQNPEFVVIRNDPKLQAVREKDTNSVGAVFWEAGTLGGYEVSAPMIVMVKEEEETVTIAISDPTWKLEEATFKLGRDNLELMEECSGATFKDGVITIDFKDAQGKTFELKFKKNKVCGTDVSLSACPLNK